MSIQVTALVTIMVAATVVHCKVVSVYPDKTLSEDNDQASDDHCHGLHCPSYKVLKTTSDYELRLYRESKWVATELKGYNFKNSSKINFMKLFAYISGANKNGTEIPMTAPVLTRISVTQGPFCASKYLMHFFVPPAFQKNTPVPISKKVTIVTYPEIQVYVRSYGGFSNLEKIQENGAKLTNALKKEKIKFNEKEIMVAGYDSPFRLLNRHNEVMLERM